MSMQTNKGHSKILVVGLSAWVAFGWVVSCSSSDEAPGGGRIEHPVEPGPKAPPPPLSIAPPPTNSTPPSASALATPEPPPRRRSRSEAYEEITGTKLSVIDKAILDDCPSRVWSKNVPKRSCTKDEQCGDGFCDRGHCAAIWTCSASFGQRCERDQWCRTNLCIDGRCRSCLSDAECIDEPDNQDPKCTPDNSIPGSRGCYGVAGSREGDAVPRRPPEAPKK